MTDTTLDRIMYITIRAKGKQMKNIITAGILGVAILGAAYAGNEALKMPDVHFSYSTNECVEVVNYTDEVFSCDNYPTKFNHVWVQ